MHLLIEARFPTPAIILNFLVNPSTEHVLPVARYTSPRAIHNLWTARLSKLAFAARSSHHHPASCDYFTFKRIVRSPNKNA